MKIAMIAMSGVRAHNEELTKYGLTLPGFVERSKVIASMPSLSLLTLAALTPKEFEIDYWEVQDFSDKDSLPTDYDLVAISTFSAQIYEAYQIADEYRAKGIPVVMGGLHVTVLPDEAQQHCTTVVVGEGEVLWPKLLTDFLNGGLKSRYTQKPGEDFNLAHSPIPRYDLLKIEKYNRLTVQTSRGCPHRCNFCASSILLTPKYKAKPIDKVIAEIRYIKSLWPQPFIEFADDNSFVLRDHYKALLKALKDENVHWFTEVDVSIAEDEDLLDLMKESGCRQVLIGLESPNRGGLENVELRRNWKQDKQPYYEWAINQIQSRGVSVNGCFILGLDGDTPEIFDHVYEFVKRTSLFEVQITVLTPFPGTPLYEQFKREGRLIEDRAWHKCTLFDVNYFPKQMSVKELEDGIIKLSKQVYDKKFIDDRRRNFFKNLRDRQKVL